jgi:hypothetical protein
MCLKSGKRLGYLIESTKGNRWKHINNMTSMIVGNLVKFGGLIKNGLEKKLISIGIDGAMVFQSAKTKITT